MVLTGLASFAEDVQLSTDPAVHTVGLLLRTGSTAVLVHLMLAFSGGHLQRRADRVIVGVAYVWAFVLRPLSSLFTNTSTRNLLLVVDRPVAVDVLGQLGLPLAVAATVSLVERWYKAQWSIRHVLTPVVVVNLVIGLSALGAAAFWNTELGLYRPFVTGYQVAACLLPLAFLIGVLRVRLGRSTVARLLESLNAPVSAEGLRDLISTALSDPGLVVAFRRVDGPGLVGFDGLPVAFPDAEDPRRAATEVCHHGRPVAVLEHNRALLDDDHVLRAVSAAAGLALENEHLGQLRAQLAEVRGSRARIVAASQAERARIERDLHDGVQARLVAALISVRQASGGAVEIGSGTARATLDRAAAGLEEALADLRRIAHGIRPVVLAEAGLVGGVRALLDGMPIEYELDAGVLPPLPPSLEETMYYVVPEAATNAVKLSTPAPVIWPRTCTRGRARWGCGSATTGAAVRGWPRAAGCSGWGTGCTRRTGSSACPVRGEVGLWSVPSSRWRDDHRGRRG